MDTRATHRLVACAAALALVLAGCAGGTGVPADAAQPSIERFAADRQAYFVGEEARLSVLYTNGTGRIEPGGLPVASGATVTTPPLPRSTSYRLVVDDGRRTVERRLDLAVGYRGRFRAIGMPFARAEHAACVLQDGRVVVLGGEDGGNVLPETTYVFDPVSETFAQFIPLSSGRIGFVASTLADGNVLVAGGLKGLTQAPEAEVIEIRAGVVTPTANSPVRMRHAATATLLRDGRVLIAGGLTSFGADETAEVYDPVSRAFALLPARMAKGRYAHTATQLEDGRVLIYGGFTNDARPAPPEVFDPQTGAFTVLEMPDAAVRGNHVAVLPGDGSLWIIGGEDFHGAPLSSALRLGAGSASFERAGPLATPRTFFGAAPLTDGRVLAAGGSTGASLRGNVTDTAETLGPPGSRHDAPPMSTPRSLHSVTPLANGKVLIAGGLDASLAPLASAEIYE